MLYFLILIYHWLLITLPFRFSTRLFLLGSATVNSESYGFALDSSRNQGVMLGRKADFSPYLYTLCTSSKPFLGATDVVTYPRSLAHPYGGSGLTTEPTITNQQSPRLR